VEEILQDVLLKIWNKREEIIQEKGFKTFIYRIADNMAIDLFRKSGRDKALQLELWAASISFYLHTAERGLDKEKVSIVQEAIQSLCPIRIDVVMQCKFEDESCKEGEDMMGTSVSTLSHQLLSAMQDIREYSLNSDREDYLISLIFLAVVAF